MNLNNKFYYILAIFTILSVFFVPVFAENEAVDNGDPGSIGPPDEPPMPDTPEATPEPTPVPTIVEVIVEPTAVPTIEPTVVETIVVTLEPTVIFPTAEITADPTVVPTTEPTTDVTLEPTVIPTTVEVTTESTIVPTTEPTFDVTLEPTVIPTTVEVTTEPTIVPTTEPTFDVTLEPTVIPTTAEVTTEPTVVPTTEPTTDVTLEPTVIPTTAEVTTGPTTLPHVTVSPTLPPGIDTPGDNQTFEVPTPVIVPVEQHLAIPQGNVTTTIRPENNVTVISPDPLLVNATSDLVGTSTLIPELNVTSTTPDAVGQNGNNYTWSDPPLNTSADNPYYTGTGWVINVPGHNWVMDMNSSNNTGFGVTLSDNTFSGFGSNFAILINTPNVIFDGMGAILNGNNATRYGIIVQNSSASDLYTINGPLGGISITNITLTGFQEAGIFFNNVIGNRPGDIASDITDVHADSNNVTIFPGYNSGSGIVLQNSQHVEVSNSTANNNGQSGISLTSSSNNNNIIGNTASGNNQGFSISDSTLNILSDNNATGNTWSGFSLGGSNNLISGNNASGNDFFGFDLSGSTSNTLSGNTASGNNGFGFYFQESISNTLSGNTASGNTYDGFYLYNSTLNTLSGNTASGNDQFGFILLENSTLNTLSGNTASGNFYDGFFLVDSTFNTLSRNTASGNILFGFNLQGDSNSNTLSGNTASGNDFGFIILENATSNTLLDNTATGNDVGFSLQNTDSNNVINNRATGNNFGFFLYNTTLNTLSGNTASGNTYDGFQLYNSDSNILTSNTASGNSDGFLLYNSSSNSISSNIIPGNSFGLWLLENSSRNTIYNNYFNNADNVYVDSSITGTIWNVTPTPGINIAGGPNLGGNYWADPYGSGWSQTHPDIGNGFNEPYNITSDLENIDQHPLVLFTPTPTPPTPHPNPPHSGSYDVILPSFPAIPLPYDSVITVNNFPQNMEPGHTYTVGLTVKNTGTLDWSSKSGIDMVSSSPDGFTFNPAKSPIPDGVVIHPGESYTFTVEINVPSAIKSGTYPLRFSLANTIQTKTGPVIIRIGETLAQNVIVGTPVAPVVSSVVKMGVKTPLPSPTLTSISTGYAPRQFTTIIPGTVVNRSIISTYNFIAKPPVTPGYIPGTGRDLVQRNNPGNATIVRDFNVITALL